MATLLEELKIVLGFKVDGVQGAQSAINSFTKGAQRDIGNLKGMIGGFFTAGVAREIGRAVIDMATRIKDLAEQTGLGTDEVQKFDIAFKKVGLSAEDAAAAFGILSAKRDEALEKGGAAALLFQRFGISESELRSLKTGADIFARISQGADSTNQSQRNLWGDIFGTKGNKAGKLLAGAQSLNEGGGDGVIISDKQIKEIDDAAKAFENGAREFKTAAAPLVTALINWTAEAGSFWLGDKAAKNKSTYERTQTIRSQAELMLGNKSTSESGRKKAKEILSRTAWYRDQDFLEADQNEMEKALREERGGKKDNVKEFPSSQQASASGFVGFSQFSADAKKSDESLGKSAQDSVMKTGSSSVKKKVLKDRIAQLYGMANDAESLGDWDTATKHRNAALGAATELAGMDSAGKSSFTSDSVAQVGGQIGGASVMSVSLEVSRSQLENLKEIVKQFPILIKAVEDANSNTPRRQLG